MIELHHNLPPNVRGYSIIGTLEAADYEQLRPYLKAASLRLHRGLNLLVDVTRAEGLSTKALWEEAKLEWQTAGRVQKVALVGPPLWTRPFVKLADMLRLGTDVHTFSPEKREEAIGWLTGVIAYQ